MLGNEPTLYDVFATKLAAIDHECESVARTEIDKLFSQAVYDGSRFRVPSFQEAAGIWLRLINQKEKDFCAEISRTLGIWKPLPRDDFLGQAMSLIEGYFQESHFLPRLNNFVQRVGRHASRYGIKFDESAYRLDLAAAAYEAGVKNRLRQAFTNVSAELVLHMGNTPKVGSWRNGVRAVTESLELKPNVMGIGLNLNEIIRRLLGRK